MNGWGHARTEIVWEHSRFIDVHRKQHVYQCAACMQQQQQSSNLLRASMLQQCCAN